MVFSHKLKSIEAEEFALKMIDFLLDNMENSSIKRMINKFLSVNIDFRQILEKSNNKEKLNDEIIKFFEPSNFYMELKYLLLLPKSEESKEYLRANIKKWNTSGLSLSSLAKILDDSYENDDLSFEFIIEILLDIVNNSRHRDRLEIIPYLLLNCKKFASSIKIPENVFNVKLPHLTDGHFSKMESFFENEQYINMEYEYLLKNETLPNLYGLICFSTARYVCRNSKLYKNQPFKLINRDSNSLYTTFISLF